MGAVDEDLGHAGEPARPLLACRSMEEIAPGVFHWKAVHPIIRAEVSSYYVADSGTLLDPMVPPDEGLEWFGDDALYLRDGQISERLPLEA